MNTETPNSNPVTTPLRCQYTTPKGRRCRQRVSTDTTLCWRHLHPALRPKDVPDLAALANRFFAEGNGPGIVLLKTTQQAEQNIDVTGHGCSKGNFCSHRKSIASFFPDRRRRRRRRLR
jgi:hypothetical protein